MGHDSNAPIYIYNNNKRVLHHKQTINIINVRAGGPYVLKSLMFVLYRVSAPRINKTIKNNTYKGPAGP